MTTTRPCDRAGILYTIVAVGLAAMSAAAVQGPSPQPSAHRFERIAGGRLRRHGQRHLNTGSNSVVIVNADDVVVVDSHVTPWTGGPA